MVLADIIGIWVGAFMTLAVLSFVWKENKIYRVAEAMGVGGAVANTLVIVVNSLRATAIYPMLKGDFLLIVPLVMGLMIFTRVTDHYWLARYPTLFMVGVGTGIMISGIFQAQIISNIIATISQLFVAGNVINIIGSIVGFIGCITVISYFIFIGKRGPVLTVTSKIARIFMMFSFGNFWAAELILYIGMFVGVLIFIIDTFIRATLLGI